MTPPDRSLRAILERALGFPPGPERSAYLDEACRHDPDTRAQVEALLTPIRPGDVRQATEASFRVDASAADSRPTRLATVEGGTDPTPWATSARVALFEGPGTVVGPYKLLQKIGEGGMGSVFMAEQEQPIRRKVALKVIKPGMDTTQVIARFKAERQALALMEHPNIARVLDVGATASGRPFFVMELVRGIPITDYCDRNHLTPRQRLELFLPVCRAIQHAHQKGIIHRDIKPSNVMVTLNDGVPEPKVIDFGVAKAIEQPIQERTQFTEYGALVGTLEYMSPEQAELGAIDVDTRSDIYSLGVLLYELLTGSTPLDRARLRKAAYTEMLRRIREEEPPRPSTRLGDAGDTLASISAGRNTDPSRLSRLVRGDLDRVVMKSLAKDRARRYETANGFARDIQRYLDGDAVEASPPSTRYRIGKFARKHRAFLATATAFVVLLVAATVASTTLAYRADRERARAIAAEQAAQDQLVRAVAAEKQATEQRGIARSRERTAIDAVRRFTDVVRDNPELKNDPKLEPLRRGLLKEPQSFFKRLRDELRADQVADAATLLELAEILADYGRLTDEIGDQRDSLAAYREAAPILERLVAVDPGSVSSRASLARIYQEIGRLHQAAVRYDDARSALERALAIREQLARDRPADLQARSDLGTSHHFIASFYDTLGRKDAAARSCDRAAAIREQLVRDDPTNPSYQSDLATTYHNMAGSRFEAGLAEGTEHLLRRALEIQERLARDHPTNWKYQRALALNLNNTGVAYLEDGRSPEALALFERARAIHERMARDEPSNSRFQDLHSWSYYLIASTLRQVGRADEAARAHEFAREHHERLVADNPANAHFRQALATILFDMGELRRTSGREAEAFDCFDRARALVDRLAREQPDSYNQLLYARINQAAGQLHLDSGRPAAALASFRDALANGAHLAREVGWSARRRIELYWMQQLVGELLAEAGQDAAALESFERASTLRGRLDAEEATVATFRRGLATPLGNDDAIRIRLGVAAATLARWHRGRADHAHLIGEGPEAPIGVASLVWLHQARGQLHADAGRRAEAARAADLARQHRGRLGDDEPAALALDGRLAAVLAGQAPADEAERSRLAGHAFRRGRYAAAAGLHDAGFAASPTPPAGPQLHAAAVAAALAIAGRGEDAPPRADPAHARLRGRALAWLRLELADRARSAAAGDPSARRRVAAALRHWRRDPDLHAIRAEGELADLSPAEQGEFRQLWGDVDQLLGRVEG